MWMLSFIPDVWLHLAVLGILGTGLLIYVLSYFTVLVPPLMPAREFIRILGTVVIVAGVFFYGSYDTEMSWRNKVADAEARVAQAEVASKQANEKLAKAVAGKTKYIQGRTEYIKQYVDREVTKYDVKFAPGGQCEIPKEFIKAINDAAEPPK